MSTTTRLREALHETVVRAARRITDTGLATRILADEGRRIVDERDAQLRADRLHALLRAPWRDVWGRLHCMACGGLLTDYMAIGEPACSCPRTAVAA